MSGQKRREPAISITGMAGFPMLQCESDVFIGYNFFEMTDKDIIHIAVMNGWKASVMETPDGTKRVCFRRYMGSGIPFTFTAEISDGRAESLAGEIISLVDAIDPETCAVEWMVKSGMASMSSFRQAVTDMDGIRTEAWLLACGFLEFSGNSLLP